MSASGGNRFVMEGRDGVKKSDWLHDIPRFSLFVLRRLGADQGLRVAAALSYTSLLALVPLAVMTLSMLATFPAFEGVREQFNDFAFQNLLPDTGEQVRRYFESFIANAGSLTAVGIVFLAATAIMLLNTIEVALNHIFRVVRRRPMGSRLLMFWALLTLGPLLLGASFSLSTYITALTRWAQVDAFTGLSGYLLRAVPALLMVALLTVFYALVPWRPVRWRDALVGGLVGGLGFAVLRWGFGLYLLYFPTYATVYGALSAVPILLIWMYLSWILVLVGAVVTAALPEWRTRRTVALHETLALRLRSALDLLAVLVRASQRGCGVRHGDLLHHSGIGGELMERLLEDLRRAGYIAPTPGDRWVLSRDPASVSLYDLHQVLGLDLAPAARTVPGQSEEDMAWLARLHGILERVDGTKREAMTLSLKELLL